MNIYRFIAFGIAAVSAAAMLYVGLFQSRLVGRLLCPIFGDGCEGVGDAPFARPFGIPDGYIGAALYVAILALQATHRCPFRKSYPRVAMMQSTQDGHSNDGTRPLDCSMQWRILVQ